MKRIITLICLAHLFGCVQKIKMTRNNSYQGVHQNKNFDLSFKKISNKTKPTPKDKASLIDVFQVANDNDIKYILDELNASNINYLQYRNKLIEIKKRNTAVDRLDKIITLDKDVISEYKNAINSISPILNQKAIKHYRIYFDSSFKELKNGNKRIVRRCLNDLNNLNLFDYSYTTFDSLKSIVYAIGRSNTFIIIKNKTNIPLDENSIFESIKALELNDSFNENYFNYPLGVEPDYILTIYIDEIEVSEPSFHESSNTVAATIADGTECYEVNVEIPQPSQTVTKTISCGDSSVTVTVEEPQPPLIKKELRTRPKYIDVSARVTESSVDKYANLTFHFAFDLLKDSSYLSSKSITTSYHFRDSACSYSGDGRALTGICSGSLSSPPSNEAMLLEVVKRFRKELPIPLKKFELQSLEE